MNQNQKYINKTPNSGGYLLDSNTNSVNDLDYNVLFR